MTLHLLQSHLDRAQVAVAGHALIGVCLVNLLLQEVVRIERPAQHQLTDQKHKSMRFLTNSTVKTCSEPSVQSN